MSEEKTDTIKTKKLKKVNPKLRSTSIALTIIAFIIFLSFLVFGGGNGLINQITGALIGYGFYFLSIRGIAKYNKMEPYIYLEITEEEYKKRTKGRPIMMIGYIIVGIIVLFFLLWVLTLLFGIT